MSGNNTNFPIEVNSSFINFLQKLILRGIKILALLMVIVIFWSMANVIFQLYLKSQDPIEFFSNTEDLLNIFGVFLIVLIAIEIFINIILYLKQDMNHLKLVIATALMAISRKVIILDYHRESMGHMIGMSILIFALVIAYWLLHKSHPNPSSVKTSEK